MKVRADLYFLLFVVYLFIGCTKQEHVQISKNNLKELLQEIFGSNIDLDDILNYSNQEIHSYILKRNSNSISH
jgi:hypothetical protein